MVTWESEISRWYFTAIRGDNIPQREFHPFGWRGESHNCRGDIPPVKKSRWSADFEKIVKAVLYCDFLSSSLSSSFLSSLSALCKNFNVAHYSKSTLGINTILGILAHHEKVLLQDKEHNSESCNFRVMSIVEKGLNSKSIIFRIMYLVLQLLHVMTSKYSKYSFVFKNSNNSLNRTRLGLCKMSGLVRIPVYWQLKHGIGAEKCLTSQRQSFVHLLLVYPFCFFGPFQLIICKGEHSHLLSCQIKWL